MKDDELVGLVETEVNQLSSRFTELGLKVPTSICILPTNFLYASKQTDLFFAPSFPDLKVLLREAGVAVYKIEPEGVKIPFRDDRDSTLILPAIFLGASYLSGNPHLVNVALGVLANYVTHYFRGKTGHNRVRCTVIVEKTEKKTTKKIEYDGAAEGFDKLIDAINKAVK